MDVIYSKQFGDGEEQNGVNIVNVICTWPTIIKQERLFVRKMDIRESHVQRGSFKRPLMESQGTVSTIMMWLILQ